AEALVMQVRPHHNGEIFLSKRAIDQDPAFFGWPFIGRSTPKKSTNPSYPQRVPDPVVDIRVINAAGAELARHDRWALNTVYYSTKHEIRITVPPSVCRALPDFSILVMRLGASIDYEMDFYMPGSADYTTYLNTCNQTMPSG